MKTVTQRIAEEKAAIQATPEGQVAPAPKHLLVHLVEALIDLQETNDDPDLNVSNAEPIIKILVKVL